MAAPPLLDGALKLTVACALPVTADTAVGAPGTVKGVTVLEGVEAAPVAAPLLAVTVKL